ncbi:MAG: hypothetical protein ACLQVL_28280 [Terriglobia bacterium]
MAIWANLECGNSLARSGRAGSCRPRKREQAPALHIETTLTYPCPKTCHGQLAHVWSFDTFYGDLSGRILDDLVCELDRTTEDEKRIIEQG